ncbi:MAG: iron-containing alcohol dehydrogenase [Planctomycetota bacterium]
MIDPGLVRSAREFIHADRGPAYAFGTGVLAQAGTMAAQFGPRALVVTNGSPWQRSLMDLVRAALDRAGVSVAAIIRGARPDTPREDVLRIRALLDVTGHDVIVALGSGSTIDAVKAAAAMCACGPSVRDPADLFGAGRVTAALASRRGRLTPIVAVQTAAGSAAHLTKYANVTNPAAGQKMLIIDDAITPPAAVFDYGCTVSAPHALTVNGAFDGIAHCLEVYYGAPAAVIAGIEPMALTGIRLVIAGLESHIARPGDLAAREALGLGTDLGGCAIMAGGTSGGHLTSFSLVDILPHGRACALMNPYFSVFFAPAIGPQLQAVAALLRETGYLLDDTARLSGYDLGLAVARGLFNLSHFAGLPTTLAEVDGFKPRHIQRMLNAMAAPALASKLRNMPVPIDPADAPRVLAPVLEAARTGDLELITG